MKNTRLSLLTGILVLLLPVLAQSAAAPIPTRYRLTWDDPNPQGSIVSYTISELVDTTTKKYVELATVTTKEWRINLVPGNHVIAVMANGTNSMSSDYSEPKTVSILVAVVNLQIVQ